MRRAAISLLLFAVMTAFGLTAAAAVRTHAIEVEDYFTQVTMSEVATSPDGRFVAFTQMTWGEPDAPRSTDLWVVESATGTPRRLTFDGVGARSLAWSCDGAFVYFLGTVKRAAEGRPPYDGSVQVWRVAPSGGEPFAVTRGTEGVDLFDLDGSTLYTVRGRTVSSGDFKALQEELDAVEYGQGTERLSELWALDLVTWRERLLLEPGRVIRELEVSPDGDRIAMVTTPEEELITHEGWSRLDVLEVASGHVESLTGPAWRAGHPSPYGWLDGLAWAPDGRALAFTLSFDGYPTEVWVAEWAAGGAALHRLDRPPGVTVVAGSLAWRPGSRTLLFRGDERARVRLWSVDEVRGQAQGPARALTPGDAVVEQFSVADTENGIAVALGTATHPGDLFEVVPGGPARRLTTLNPQVDTWKLPQIQVVRWTAPDGVEVEGVLELPPDWTPADGPLPLVVEIHGGPTAATHAAMEFWIYGRTLLPATGYALLSPNYRGSTGYGDRFMTDLVGRENDVEVADILSGVDAMVERGVADPERLGVMGWSNGGFLVNCLVTRTDRFKAASSGAGVLDQVIQWGIEDTPGHVVNFMRGLPWQVPDAYRAASPVFNLDRVKTPILIHVGGDDPRVPPAHSRALFRALRHYLEVPTQLVVYPGEGHTLTVREHRLAKMKWDLAWFGRYLAP